MITDKQVEQAAEYIRVESANYAKAKADRIYLDQFRKSKKALLMNECEEQAVNAKEIYAYAHPEYRDLLEGLGAAVEKEEQIRWKMKAAELRIEIFRTQQANNRIKDNSLR